MAGFNKLLDVLKVMLPTTSSFPHGMPLVGLLFKLDVFLLGQGNLRGCEGGRY